MRNEVEQITEAVLQGLLTEHDISSEKVIHAMRMIFVEGASRRTASQASGVDYATVHRTVRKLQGVCPHCGQQLPEKAAASPPSRRRNRKEHS